MTTRHGKRMLLFGILLVASVSAAGSSVTEVDGWRFRWGDSPVAPNGRLVWLTEELTGPDWLDQGAVTGAQPEGPINMMWARVEMPEGNWRNPVLYLPQVLIAFEAYVDTTLIYRHGRFESTPGLKYSAMLSHVVPLPPDVAGRTISCRIYSLDSDLIGLNVRHQPALVGQQQDVVRYVFGRNIDTVILGSLFFFTGMVSLAIFLRRWRHRIWYLLSFAWLTGTIGMFYIFSNSLVGLLGVPPAFSYHVNMFAFAAFPVGMYMFLEQITGEHRVVRRLWQLHLAYLVIATPLDALNLVLMPTLQMFYSIGFLMSIVVGLVVVFRSFAADNWKARLFGVGFLIFSVTGLHDLLVGMNVLPLVRWLSAWGMLAFILCLSYILEQTYSDTLRQLRVYAQQLEHKSHQLEEYSSTLEQRVERRTHDLAAKNEQLVETMQELQDAQAQMVMQDKMASLGNLVAGLAHELNTPMGAVMSAADVETRCITAIDREIESSADIGALRESRRFQLATRSLRESNALLTRGSKRIATIMSSLKSFARLDEATFQEVDLHEGLESTLTLIDHEMKDRIEVVREYGDLPPVGCNANQINQVFMNLLINAVQAMDGPGTLTIRTTASDSEVTVQIADTGVGIPAADQPRIFDPGYTTKGVGVGTGLGLSICYQTVRDHGGRIAVESETGRGSTFELVLPVNGS